MSFAPRHLEGGVELAKGDTIIRVDALRVDVLRVRIGREGALPEDASWAALAEARSTRATTTPEPYGFATQAVRAAFDLATGALAVRDRSGRVILADVAVPFTCDGEGFRLHKALPAGTRIFGLGEKAGGLDRRGRSFAMWNTDAYRYQESTDPLYKDIPFFIGFAHGQAWGVFLDNSFRSSFEFGVIHPDRLSFGADGGAIDYYIFTGPHPKDVQRAYAWLTGPPPLPPLWAFGFQLSRYSYLSAAEVRAVAAGARGMAIPCDMLWFDIDMLDRKRPFTTDAAAFPDLPGLIQDLRQQDFRAVVITDLHVPCLAQQGYAPYDSGAAGDHFVKDASGAPFIGEVWPGPCVFPDFTRKATRDWWGTLFRERLLLDHVDGIWNDMNEPSVFGIAGRTMPLDVVHCIEEPGFATREASHREIHNVFGMQNARATHDGMLALRPDVRPLVVSRAAYAGGQRSCVVWTGDNSSSWNHLRMSTPMLLGLGLGGFAFAGCDIGGFSGSPHADLLTRWLQLGMFNPLARDHTDKGTRRQEPWVHGEQHTAIRRRAIEARYRLLPYIYTLAEEASRTGLPMMRPLFMEFPDGADGEALDLHAPNQFMWGPAMLVAPAPFGEALDRYQVILPVGTWYDYWTGEKLEDLPPAVLTGGSGAANAAGRDPTRLPRAMHVTPSLDRLPVYVRAGSIIPRQPLVQSTAQVPQGPLQLAIYPGPACEGSIYLDDGVSFGFRAGAYLRTRYTCEPLPGGGLAIAIGQREGDLPPWWDTLELVVHGLDAARMPLRVDGSAGNRFDYDPAARTLRLSVPERAAGSAVRIGIYP